MYGVYAEHRNCIKPDTNVEIWRYLTFTKFVSLLVKKSLFFSNLLALRSGPFSDPNEGTFPKKIRDTYKELAELDDPNWKIATSGILAGNEENSSYTSVNCWHINTVETLTMWKNYVPSGEGVAIRSTFDQLRTCFISHPSTQAIPVHIGVVTYIDHAEAQKPASFEFIPTTFKDLVFGYENELRALIYLADQARSVNELAKAEMRAGISTRVDLEKLISAIILPPNCPAWIKELIISLLEKYLVNVPIQESNLQLDNG